MNDDSQLSSAKAGSTVFQDDGQVISKITRSIMNESGPTPFDANEIADFLAKPVIVAQGLFNTSHTRNTTISSYLSIATLMEAQQIWYRKLAGYKLIRATAVVKLVVNANPFQAGRLILTFNPCYRHLTSTEQSAKVVMLSSKTMTPNVELNIADSSAEMRIPYITPTYYYDRSTGLYDWGSIAVTVLSPLAVGSSGETEVGYTLFLSFEDVELAAPIYGPESALRSGPKSEKKASRVDMTLAKESKTASSGGFVESTSAKIAQFSEGVKSSVFGKIPVVGSAADLVSGVANTIGSVSSIFGWSKSLSQDVSTPMFLHPYRNIANSDGNMASDIPSLTNNPLIVPNSQVFGTAVDEMSCAFLRKIPCYNEPKTWATTDVAGTLIYSAFVGPSYYAQFDTKTVGSKIARFYNGSPMYMLSTFFDMCRGGHEITFKFVKTMYHTGRLVISYTPNLDAVNLNQTPYLLREIVDLKSADSITLKIPYLYGEAYRKTTDNLGIIRVHVLNELRCPETVSQAIDVLVYTNPADDFELAIPVPTPQVPFSPESGLSSIVNNTLQEKPIGNSEISQDLSHMMKCTADPLISVKQLATTSRRIFTEEGGFTSNAATISPIAAPLWKNTGALTLTGPAATYWGDYLSYLTTGYAFSRGGIRITCAGLSTSGITLARFFPAGLTEIGIKNSVDGSFPVACSNAVPLSTLTAGADVPRAVTSGGFDIVCPHYTQTPIRLNRFQSQANPYIKVDVPDTYKYMLTAVGALDPNNWYRSGADDFCLGYFCGFAPLCYIYEDAP